MHVYMCMHEHVCASMLVCECMSYLWCMSAHILAEGFEYAQVTGGQGLSLSFVGAHFSPPVSPLLLSYLPFPPLLSELCQGKTPGQLVCPFAVSGLISQCSPHFCLRFLNFYLSFLACPSFCGSYLVPSSLTLSLLRPRGPLSPSRCWKVSAASRVLEGALSTAAASH